MKNCCFDSGVAVATVDPEVYREDEKQANIAPVISVFCLLVVWAGKNRARLSVIGKVLKTDERTQAEIAAESRISRQAISRAMSDARVFLKTEIDR